MGPGGGTAGECTRHLDCRHRFFMHMSCICSLLCAVCTCSTCVARTLPRTDVFVGASVPVGSSARISGQCAQNRARSRARGGARPSTGFVFSLALPHHPTTQTSVARPRKKPLRHRNGRRTLSSLRLRGQRRATGRTPGCLTTLRAYRVEVRDLLLNKRLLSLLDVHGWTGGRG